MTEWADLRQVVFASTDPERDGRQLRESLRLGTGFGDPELGEHGLTDDTMAVGDFTFLEIVSPTTAGHPLAGWLAKRNGAGGYLLSIQVSDIAACLRRCAAEGVRITLTHVVQGHTIVQLHPRDMGISVELDGVPTRGRWFWDSFEVERRDDARADDVIGVELAVDDPAAMGARWATILGLVPDGSDPTRVDLGDRTVRFVPAGDTPPRLHTVELHASDPEDEGVELAICNTILRLTH